MTKQFLVTWLGSFVLITITSIVWHVALFEQRYLELGVFTRMADPIYAFGFLAWIMEATAITFLYLRSGWAEDGLMGSLKLAWTVSLYAAASVLVGTAAKVQISDMSGWFLLEGGFIFLRATILGLWLSIASRLCRHSRSRETPLLSGS